MDERLMVDTGVGRLAVRVRGEGPPAVLWPSLFVDSTSWSRVEDRLAEARRLVLVDGPGHGASGDPGRRYDAEGCADAAETILSTLGVAGPVDWVGNAWGGHVGILLAARRPTVCRTLVTLGTPVPALSPAERRRTSMLLLAHRFVGMAGFLRDGVIDVLLAPSTRQEDPDAVRLVADCLARSDRAALRRAVVSISLRRPDLTDRLGAVECPTLMVTGRDHAGWTPQQLADTVGLLPEGRSAVVEGAAYLVPLEAPTATADLVTTFWRDHDHAAPRREPERADP